MQGRSRFTSWLIALVLLVLIAPDALGNFNAAVRQRLDAADLRNTRVAISAVDLSTGQELIALNADEPMIPASNMKLITSAAALDILGPRFTFRTELRVLSRDAADPTIATLLVKGDGDPAFGDPVILERHGVNIEQLLGTWVRHIQDAGIRTVAQIVVDDRVFDRQFVHPTWPENQLNRWYCAQVAGLNFYDNTLDVLPQPTTAGQAPRVSLIPEAPFLTVSNRATTGDADTFWISRRLGTNDLTFWGKVRSRRTTAVPVTIHDPPVTFAQILSHRLALGGVRVQTIRRSAASEHLPQGQLLLAVETRIAEVLQRCNGDSQNMFAEALFKRSGRQFTGQPGGWDNGAAAVRKVLSDRLGTRAINVHVADGSGMSRDNRVTARALVQLLSSMHNDTAVGEAFLDSLAVGGESGTLRNRFRRDLQGRVLAKSGYLNGVSTMSGYLVVPDPDNGQQQRIIAFSLLFNDFRPPVHNHRIREVQDSLVRFLDEQFAPAGATSRIGG